jgi:hypothetical protein
MRFAISFLAFATIALASVIPRDDVSDDTPVVTSLTVNPATTEQLFLCKCPLDKFNDPGVHINQDLTSYQCAYARGACQWSKVPTFFITSNSAEALTTLRHSLVVSSMTSRPTARNSSSVLSTYCMIYE